ncbi:His-Xaa-Ser system radical SAM maturase HxsC [Phenylobacterium sp.]|uniref:His-Xaa-Ser system radical SAM maturase HxsC n=1 Tax=Phenylobacterium sp. TaxID=1871053 RepID=UPI002631DCB9|nr:His-Xaa-Ser system radical SAM maturase HxsC [Phenylobacterium sp.]
MDHFPWPNSMIELRLPVSAEHDTPFVVRLGYHEPVSGKDVATLVAELADKVVYEFDERVFEVTGLPACELAGDVVYIEPARGILSRWLRRGSRHNTLLVTERCDQLCIMCSQPPKKSHVDQFAEIARACSLAEPNVVIGITGGEPTLYKRELFDLLGAMQVTRPDLSFHVLTNGQHFDEADVPILQRLRSVCWGIPLYSAEPALHDAIVAKKGAFDRLHRSFSILMRAGADVELRTVLLRSNADHLPALARHVAACLPFISVWAIMQLEHIGFARNRWDELYYEHAERFDPISAALDLCSLKGIPAALYNFPRCTVPQPYRPFAAASISDWKRKFMPACEPCGERAQCSGYFEWHPAEAANERVSPL